MLANSSKKRKFTCDEVIDVIHNNGNKKEQVKVSKYVDEIAFQNKGGVESKANVMITTTTTLLVKTEEMWVTFMIIK